MSGVRLAVISSEPLSVDQVLGAVSGPTFGGLVLFVGTVRDHDDGKSVDGLAYSSHPTAERTLREVAASVAAEFPEAALAVSHRTGDLQVGDLAVVVAAACPHRATAFAAARRLIDDVKSTVPIWKHQRFHDGSEEWVGLP